MGLYSFHIKLKVKPLHNNKQIFLLSLIHAVESGFLNQTVLPVPRKTCDKMTLNGQLFHVLVNYDI